MTASVAQTFWGNLVIEDAKKDLSIRVTQEDIDGSEPLNPGSCAVAVALKRAYDGDHALVWRSAAYVVGEDRIVRRYCLPKDVRYKVVIPLDEGRMPEPGFYTLKAPQGSFKLGEGTKRVKRLAALREEGKAPPPVKRPYLSRPMVTTRLLKVIGGERATETETLP